MTEQFAKPIPGTVSYSVESLVGFLVVFPSFAALSSRK